MTAAAGMAAVAETAVKAAMATGIYDVSPVILQSCIKSMCSYQWLRREGLAKDGRE